MKSASSTRPLSVMEHRDRDNDESNCSSRRKQITGAAVGKLRSCLVMVAKMFLGDLFLFFYIVFIVMHFADRDLTLIIDLFRTDIYRNLWCSFLTAISLLVQPVFANINNTAHAKLHKNTK